MQALYLLGRALRVRSLATTLLCQAVSCEAASPVVRALAMCLLAEGDATVGKLTPQEFMQSFDPDCVLVAPTLLELQLQWVAGWECPNGPGGPAWLPDCSTLRAAALAAEEAQALRELLVWAEACGPADSGPAGKAGLAQQAALLWQALRDWAAARLDCWQLACKLAAVSDVGLAAPSSNQHAQHRSPLAKGAQHLPSNKSNGRLAQALGTMPDLDQPLAARPDQLQHLVEEGQPHHKASEHLGVLQEPGLGSNQSPALADMRPGGDSLAVAGAHLDPAAAVAGVAVSSPEPCVSGASQAGLLTEAAGPAEPGGWAAEVAASHAASSAGGSAGPNTLDYSRLGQLLSQAQRFPLLPGDQRELVAGLKASPAAVVACQADLNQYRGLIENNPMVAAWLLISINWHAQRAQDARSLTATSGAALQVYREELELLSKAIPNYLAVLCTLPMTNHSMECMTTLVDCAPPPPTVLAVFVANCIRTIDSAQEGISRAARLAKLLCAFLQHVLDRGQDGVVPAIYADVQAFCIAWSRLKEASALFRRLKALDSDDGQGEGEGEEFGGGVGSGSGLAGG
ncbi:hypothetical protein N2152v2_010294 [Parachlorella kessleri]